jgi:uncharacterized membrane protein YphA (DoxX/SURF4 family)
MYMHATVVILSVVLAVVFLGSGGAKLASAKPSLQIRDKLRVGARLWSFIGVLEVAGAIGLAVGLVVPSIGCAAAAGLSLLMIGGITAHARVGDLRHATPAVLLAILSATVILARLLTA